MCVIYSIFTTMYALDRKVGIIFKAIKRMYMFRNGCFIYDVMRLFVSSQGTKTFK
jgi:hypothetical protein